MDRPAEVAHHWRQYLSRDKNHFKFTAPANNFADSRIKFKRSLIFLLKQLYAHALPTELLREATGDRVKGSQMKMRVWLLQIVEHLVKVNISRRWDVFIIQAGLSHSMRKIPANQAVLSQLDTGVKDDMFDFILFAYLEIFPWPLDTPKLAPNHPPLDVYAKTVRPSLSDLCKLLSQVQDLTLRNEAF